MHDFYCDLIPEQFYHVFNRAVGSDKLFLQNENYYFFLQKLKFYILPVADLFSYNLLPNHFHFFLRIKTEEELRRSYKLKHFNKTAQLKIEQMPGFVLQQWSNFLNSYAKSFNNTFGRKGKLFMESVRRSEIKNENYFRKIIYYIHANAVHHGICTKTEDWPHSSYSSIIHNSSSLLKRDELLEWFGGLDAYIRFHKMNLRGI